MEHGIVQYFEQRARNARRLSALSLAVAVGLLIPLLLLRATPLGRSVRATRLLRFGLEGPPRVVQLVQMDAEPTVSAAPRNVGKVVARAEGPGNERGSAPARFNRAARGTRLPRLGDEGGGPHDLLARAIASQGRVPIFQSDELVIEELVRPVYPEEARERGIEGRVAVIAHVDTLGRVVEAEVMNASGEAQLDAASRAAVLRCRFRPYRPAGEAAQEVYAVFRFAFRIY